MSNCGVFSREVRVKISFLFEFVNNFIRVGFRGGLYNDKDVYF